VESARSIFGAALKPVFWRALQPQYARSSLYELPIEMLGDVPCRIDLFFDKDSQLFKCASFTPTHRQYVTTKTYRSIVAELRSVYGVPHHSLHSKHFGDSMTQWLLDGVSIAVEFMDSPVDKLFVTHTSHPMSPVEHIGLAADILRDIYLSSMGHKATSSCFAARRLGRSVDLDHRVRERTDAFVAEVASMARMASQTLIPADYCCPSLQRVASTEEAGDSSLSIEAGKTFSRMCRFLALADGVIIAREQSVLKTLHTSLSQQPPASSGLTQEPQRSTDDEESLSATISANEYREFIKHASVFLPMTVDLIEQVTATLSSVPLSAPHQLQRDLVFVAEAISGADGSRSDDELLVISDVMLALSGHSRYLYFLPTKGVARELAKGYSEMVDSLKVSVDASSSQSGWSFENTCLSVRYLAEYDFHKGTVHATQLKSFLLRFCNLLAKADAFLDRCEQDATQRVASWLEMSGERSPAHGNFDPSGTVTNEAPEQPLDDLLQELHSLTGLDAVKREIDDLVAFLKVQDIRRQRGMAPASISRHLVFYGNPGTGKTTVARLLSKIYAKLGFLSKGHMVETDRSGLVAGFVGQTAIKTREVCEKAIGGVLFIDEAYTLVGKENDYGQEAVDTLLKIMEDNRDNLVVVVAGYPDKMGELLNSNPGIRSRFTRFMNFADYTPEQLGSIFAGFCREGGFALTSAAAAKALDIFEEHFIQRDKHFGNARFARNLFEQSLVRHARRITAAEEISDGMLTLLEVDDVVWVG